MKRYNFPNEEQYSEICSRPSLEQDELKTSVKAILESVKINGDKALYDYTVRFDSAQLNELRVSENEILQAEQAVNEELKFAIKEAKRNIQKFHLNQIEKVKTVETTEGVLCWRKSVGIEKVGLYIPGGSAPLFSTILMLGIPAVQAGCREIILCTPPDINGEINPAILYAANLVGITQIFKIGGAQGIAAMAYGTESVPQVYKIFGPGNQFVTKAKELIQQEGVAIDMPAGPSELLILADENANPNYIASDLLSQAEHGPDSQVIFISLSKPLVNKVEKCINDQIRILDRRDFINKSISNSKGMSFIQPARSNGYKGG